MDQHQTWVTVTFLKDYKRLTWWLEIWTQRVCKKETGQGFTPTPLAVSQSPRPNAALLLPILRHVDLVDLRLRFGLENSGRNVGYHFGSPVTGVTLNP